MPTGVWGQGRKRGGRGYQQVCEGRPGQGGTAVYNLLRNLQQFLQLAEALRHTKHYYTGVFSPNDGRRYSIATLLATWALVLLTCPGA